MMPALFQLFGKFNMRCVFIEHCCMVEHVHDFLLHDFFEVSEIDNHSIFHMVFVVDGLSNHGNGKLVAMTMNVAALSIVAIEGMAGFKGKLFGNSDGFHASKIQDFHGKEFSKTNWFCEYICGLFSTTMSEELFEQLDFVENPLFEAIIEDLMQLQYTVVDGFFTLQEVEQLRHNLLAKYEADRFKKSAIGNYTNEEIDKAIRGDFILWMDEFKADAVEQLFFAKINDLVHYLNKTCFLGILQKEFHYALYPTGTFYRKHVDTFQNDDRRKLSVVCYLNEANWPKENGGELTLYLEGKTLEILPLPGRVVIFESRLVEHEVKKILASERLSITGWLKTR